MAATRLIALHIGKGKTAARSIKERIEYTLNPDKTEEGRYVTAYECDPELAWREFTIAREMYQMEYDNSEKNDIIGYHIRQSFKPGEITPEEANQVGYETAMRFTKGKHAFTVSTHVDKAHIHNHIIFNAVSLNGDKKFRNFWKSGMALRRVSDLVCMEHHLSIIPEKNQNQKKERPFSLMVDIERKMREGKGEGYRRWAAKFNLKQMAEVLCFLDENEVESFEDLLKMEKEDAERFHELSDRLKEQEAELKWIGQMKKSIIDYSKTRNVYEAYKQYGWSQTFFEAHRAEILLHKAENKTFDEYGKKKIPTVKSLTKRYEEVLSEKRKTYASYKEAREKMKLTSIARRNVETILNLDTESVFEKTRSHHSPER